jgi:hypothetical protein
VRHVQRNAYGIYGAAAAVGAALAFAPHVIVILGIGTAAAASAPFWFTAAMVVGAAAAGYWFGQRLGVDIKQVM